LLHSNDIVIHRHPLSSSKTIIPNAPISVTFLPRTNGLPAHRRPMKPSGTTINGLHRQVLFRVSSNYRSLRGASWIGSKYSFADFFELHHFLLEWQDVFSVKLSCCSTRYLLSATLCVALIQSSLPKYTNVASLSSSIVACTTQLVLPGFGWSPTAYMSLAPDTFIIVAPQSVFAQSED